MILNSNLIKDTYIIYIGYTRLLFNSYNLFFYVWKEWKEILEKSELFGNVYDSEDVIYIPNMKQNYKYLNHPKSNGQLMDIICGEDDRIVFVWKRSKEINQLFKLWCDREL